MGGNLVVRRASSHGNLLPRQPEFVVPGKRTVLSVEPCAVGSVVMGKYPRTVSHPSVLPLSVVFAVAGRFDGALL
jgi:hypothetical protein